MRALLGIFKGFNRELPLYRNIKRLNHNVYVARARSYYSQAAAYLTRLKKRSNGVSDVLNKISDHLNLYLNIFYHASEKYFRYIEKFSDGEWFHFVHKNIIHRKGVEAGVPHHYFDRAEIEGLVTRFSQSEIEKRQRPYDDQDPIFGRDPRLKGRSDAILQHWAVRARV